MVGASVGVRFSPAMKHLLICEAISEDLFLSKMNAAKLSISDSMIPQSCEHSCPLLMKANSKMFSGKSIHFFLKPNYLQIYFNSSLSIPIFSQVQFL
jgi:hypothetical protein